jgi:hypothetical protein
MVALEDHKEILEEMALVQDKQAAVVVVPVVLGKLVELQIQVLKVVLEFKYHRHLEIPIQL